MGKSDFPKKIGGLSLLSVLVMWSVLETAQKAFNVNKGLAKNARYECIDANIADLDTDGVDGQCYSVRTNFAITTDTCSNNILSESICDKCMILNQNVEQWQEYEVEVCKNQRFQGTNARVFNVKDPQISDKEKEEYNEFARNQNCHTEYRYGWRGHEDNHNNIAWNFPSTSESDRGTRSFPANASALRFEDYASPSSSMIFGGAMWDDKYMGIAKAVAFGRTGQEQMSIWNETVFYGDANDASRDSFNFCIEQNEAESNFIGGITDDEFKALPNYGDLTAYPHCHLDENTGQQLGTYKVRADCVGLPDADIRIIGTAKKDLNTNQWHMGPYQSPNYPDTGDIPTMMFVWEQDGALETGQAIDNYIDEISAAFLAFKNGIHGAMFFTFCFSCWCFKIAKEASKSSS